MSGTILQTTGSSARVLYSSYSMANVTLFAVGTSRESHEPDVSVFVSVLLFILWMCLFIYSYLYDDLFI